jgi:F-type H+-transporting ATPase subunit epsilon
MLKNPIKLEVITPEREVLSTEAASVVIPAHDGELGVLHLRSPLMCELGIGRLRYDDGGSERAIFIDGGFAQVHADTVRVLTPQARLESDVTPEIVLAAQQLAETETDGDLRSLAHRRAQVLQSLLKQ